MADPSSPTDIAFRDAAASDADAVAALHADSWRRFYRGAYSDDFLDGDVLADRHVVWSARLSQPSTATRTVVATTSDEGLVGFVHVVLDEDATSGSLVDNIHVGQLFQRRGIGSQLIVRAAAVVAESAIASGLYPMGAGAEHERTGVLSAARRDVCGEDDCPATQWCPRAPERISDEVPVRLGRRAGRTSELTPTQIRRPSTRG